MVAGRSGLKIDVDSRALRAELRRIGDSGLKAELRSANKSAAQIVADRALPNVPVRSGRLRRSVRALGAMRDASVKAGSAGVDYAAAIHWGRKRGGVIPARPFLWNAAEQSRRDVLKTYEKAVDRLLSKLRR